VLPVWLLLAPRDYLSTFLKIGVVVALAIGIVVASPEITSLKMPALTQFATSGDGPVWKGGLFPFLFITIACGAVSGFHALISSGTTPKLLANETHARYIGYGGMLMESFVAIMALVAAAILDPGIYFVMNSPAAAIGTDVASAAQVVSSWGFTISPEAIAHKAQQIGEHTILSRAGGAPTLAVGIAVILDDALPGGEGMMAFWYHFAILFEALFILTAVDAGTRAGRFMLQDLLGNFVPALRRTESWGANVVGTAGCVALWGYFLYQGVVDPLGGINTLWPLFGIANQMLAGIALMLCTVVLFRMKRDRYAWVTIVPAAWLLICTSWAGLVKIFDAAPAIGFLAQARHYQAAIANGELLGTARSMSQMQQVVVNGYVNAGLTALFLCVVASILAYSLRAILAARRSARSDHETPYVALSEDQRKAWL
jgi:carbon starvation protein CstA